jgi:hypothetical protein
VPRHLWYLPPWPFWVRYPSYGTSCVQPLVDLRSDDMCYGTKQAGLYRQRGRSSGSRCDISRFPGAYWCHSADARSPPWVALEQYAN